MNTYSDAYLEHFGDRYIDLQMLARGVAFEHYLHAPTWYESLPEHLLPLLPAQVAVARRLLDDEAAEIERAVEHLPRAANGAPIEPLYHHRFVRANRHLPFTRRVKP